MNAQPPTSTRRVLSPVDRRALGCVVIQFFVNGAMTATFAARLPEIRDRIGVSIDQLGILLTTIGLFGLVGSAIAGRVVEAWSTRHILAVGGVFMVCALPLMGLATSALVFAIALTTYVFIDVLVDISMNLQGSWISARRSAPAMNRLHGTWSLGSVVGGLVAAQAAANGVSLAVHFSVVAIVSAALIAVAVNGLLRRDEDGHGDVDPLVAVAPPPMSAGARRLPFILLALGGGFAVVMEQTGSDWAPFRLTDDFDTTAGFASLGFVAFTVGMTVARFSGDWIQVRIGRDRLHHVAIALATIGLATASLTADRWVVLAGYVIAGLGVATFLPTLYDDAARMPGRRGAGLGAMTAGTRVAGLGAPMVVGLLAGTSLSVGSAIAIVTLPCAVGFAVVTELTHRRTRRAAAARVDGVPDP